MEKKFRNLSYIPSINNKVSDSILDKNTQITKTPTKTPKSKDKLTLSCTKYNSAHKNKFVLSISENMKNLKQPLEILSKNFILKGVSTLNQGEIIDKV